MKVAQSKYCLLEVMYNLCLHDDKSVNLVRLFFLSIDELPEKKSLIFETDKNLSSLVGMLEYTKLRSKYFLRLFFSAYESDDTSSFLKEKNFLSNITIRAKKLKTY